MNEIEKALTIMGYVIILHIVAILVATFLGKKRKSEKMTELEKLEAALSVSGTLYGK